METIFKMIRDVDDDLFIENRYIYSEFISILMKQTGITTISSIPLRLSEYYDTMDYASTERMAFQLSLQLQSLEEKGYSLLFWQASDILVIEKQIYLLANLSQIVPLQKKDTSQLVLNYPAIVPFPRDICAPELLTMSCLPFITNKSASYYSLALLCLKVLNLSLDDLHGTQLFYFLDRCLNSEPSERYSLHNLLGKG